MHGGTKAMAYANDARALRAREARLKGRLYTETQAKKPTRTGTRNLGWLLAMPGLLVVGIDSGFTINW